jgi:riboflavin biosynthesis pyrimidine reductase
MEKLVDEVIIYIAPILFLGSNSPTMADGFGLKIDQSIKLNTLETQKQGDGGIIIRYQVIN